MAIFRRSAPPASMAEQAAARSMDDAKDAEAFDTKPDIPRKDPENLVVVETPEFKSPTPYTHALQRIPEEKLWGMHSSEVRAVAHDRGYAYIRPGGPRQGQRSSLVSLSRHELVAFMIEKQANDPRLHEIPSPAVAGASTPGVEVEPGTSHVGEGSTSGASQ
jgi:hypothetical protein